MKDRLPFFINNSKTFKDYRVVTKDVNKKFETSKQTYSVTVTTFEGLIGSKWHKIYSIDSGMMPSWDSKQTEILKQITKPLNDFTDYQWNEISKPIVNYWLDKQEKSHRKQKKEGAKTFWTPSGNYSLLKMETLLTHVLIAKYLNLDEYPLLDNLDKDTNGFEGQFTRSVLEPVKTFSLIEQIRKSESDHKVISKKIIDCIVETGRGRAGMYQDILNPDFKSDSKFLNPDEVRELNSLFFLYEEIKKQLEDNSEIHAIEKSSNSGNAVIQFLRIYLQ